MSNKILKHDDIQASYGVYATQYVCLQSGVPWDPVLPSRSSPEVTCLNAGVGEESLSLTETMP